MKNFKDCIALFERNSDKCIGICKCEPKTLYTKNSYINKFDFLDVKYAYMKFSISLTFKDITLLKNIRQFINTIK